MPNDPMTPTPATLSPKQLANQLFDAAFMQYRNDPRETARQVIIFLSTSIIYAIYDTAGDEAACKAMLKSVGETIATAPPPPTQKP